MPGAHRDVGARRGAGERPLRGNPSVACGHPFGNVPYGQPPLSGEAGLRAAFGGWPWGCFAALWGDELRQGLCFWHRPCRFVVGRQAAVLNSGVLVRMGAIAVM